MEPKFKKNDIVIINKPKDPRNYTFSFVRGMTPAINTVRRVLDVKYSNFYDAYCYRIGGWEWNDSNLELAPIQINDEVFYKTDNGESGYGKLVDISENGKLTGKLVIQTNTKRVYVDYENVSKASEYVLF